MTKPLSIVLCVLLLAAYGVGGLLGVVAHQNPTEMDTVSYLSTALRIQETGGLLKFIPNCLNGTYIEAIRHPIYLLALSVFAEQRISFFVHAKILSYFIGFLCLMVCFEYTRRLKGFAVALVAGAFIIFNATFLRLSTMVASESLLAVFLLLSWYCIIRGFSDKKYWLWAGLFSSLAFLTKSVAILMLPIFGLSLLIHAGRKFFPLLKSKYTWGFLLVFILVSLPLFIRNVKVYGTPLYNKSSSVMWLDDWHDYKRPRPDGREASLQTYLHDHTPAQIFSTFVRGITSRDRRMLVDGLKPFRFWAPLELESLTDFHRKTVAWQGLWALLIGAACLYGLMRSSREEKIVIGVTGVIWFAFVGWYSKIFEATPPTRLLYPLLFLILIYAAHGLLSGLAYVLKPEQRQQLPTRYAPIGAGVFLVLFLICVGLNYDFKNLNIMKSYTFGPIFKVQLAWMNRTVQPGQKVLVGNVFSTRHFYIEPFVKAEVQDWPKVNNINELQEFIRSNQFDYGILDLATVVYNRQVFGDYFDFGQKFGLRQTKPLPALFKPIPRDPKIPPIYELYAFDRGVTHE